MVDIIPEGGFSSPNVLRPPKITLPNVREKVQQVKTLVQDSADKVREGLRTYRSEIQGRVSLPQNQQEVDDVQHALSHTLSVMDARNQKAGLSEAAKDQRPITDVMKTAGEIGEAMRKNGSSVKDIERYEQLIQILDDEKRRALVTKK